MSIALSIAFGSVNLSASLERRSAQDQNASGTMYSSKLMADGKQWTTHNLNVWRQMAKHYGGIREDSDDSGKAAYKALLIGGSSGFNALLGGGISDDGQYARLGAQGFYSTASESDPVSAWLYNFGQGGLSLNRHEPTVTKRTLPPPSVDGLGPQHRFQVEHSCQRTGDSALLVTLMVTLNPPSEVTSVRQAGGRVETGPSSRSTLAEQR